MKNMTYFAVDCAQNLPSPFSFKMKREEYRTKFSKKTISKIKTSKKTVARL